MSLHGVLPSSTSLTMNNFASLTQLNSSDGSEPPPSSLLDYGLPLSLIDVDLAASATRNLISSSSAPTASSVATPTFATAPELTSRGATILTSTSSASPVSSATVTPASTTCTIAIGPPSPQLSFLAGGPSELTVTNAESQAPSRLPRYSDCIPWMASISSGSLLGMKSMPSMASPRVSDESAPFAEDTDQDPDQDQDQASQSRSDSDESDSESPGTLHIDEPTPADRSCDSIQAREHLWRTTLVTKRQTRVRWSCLSQYNTGRRDSYDLRVHFPAVCTVAYTHAYLCIFTLQISCIQHDSHIETCSETVSWRGCSRQTRLRESIQTFINCEQSFMVFQGMARVHTV